MMTQRKNKNQSKRPALVSSISDNPAYRPSFTYVTVKGRGRTASAWLVDGGRRSMINLNSYLGISFKNKMKAREWAREYARDKGVQYCETKGERIVKFN